MEISIKSKVILPHHHKAPKAAFRSLRSRVTGIDVVDVFNVSGRPDSARPILILHPTNLNQPAGLRAARARGRQGGRPKALDRDRRDLAVKLYEEKQ